MFSKEDLSYLGKYNIREEDLEMQLKYLSSISNYIKIIDAAVPDNGIFICDNIDKYIHIYDEYRSDYNILKFVPASGAATRMFKRLITFKEKPDESNLEEGGFYSVRSTFDNIRKFAFFDKLKESDFSSNNLPVIADKILFSKLNYANTPKGLIEFHKYDNGSLTAFEEQIIEAYKLGDDSNPLRVHFTISEEHKNGFYEKLKELKQKKTIETDITFSFQEKSTDTIAIYENGDIVRDNSGNILLRPGGHGSLIYNLNNLDCDIVFIKNIDNIVHESYLKENVKYKKYLGGLLISLVNHISMLYKELSSGSKDAINKTSEFLKLNFGIKIKEDMSAFDLREILNRPVRVCGMVKNTGEPGGGPFWVEDNKGAKSLQIVEKAQIDLSDISQNKYFEQSTHFNPVDLVCYLKSPEGKKFDLNDFVDKDTSFVTDKTYDGKPIKVLEHPGLWNGAMAKWLTMFVEVPLITFNPVKELNDLLRKEHQAK